MMRCLTLHFTLALKTPVGNVGRWSCLIFSVLIDFKFTEVR